MNNDELEELKLRLASLQASLRDYDLAKDLIKINAMYRSWPTDKEYYLMDTASALKAHSPDRDFSQTEIAQILDITWKAYTKPNFNKTKARSLYQYVIQAIKSALDNMKGNEHE